MDGSKEVTEVNERKKERLNGGEKEAERQRRRNKGV